MRRTNKHEQAKQSKQNSRMKEKEQFPSRAKKEMKTVVLIETLTMTTMSSQTWEFPDS